MDILKLENLIRSDYGNTAGMVVLQDGETVCESCFLFFLFANVYFTLRAQILPENLSFLMAQKLNSRTRLT